MVGKSWRLLHGVKFPIRHPSQCSISIVLLICSFVLSILFLLFGIVEGEVVLDKVFLQLNCSLAQRLVNLAAVLSAAELAASISSSCLKRCEHWIVREKLLDFYNKTHSSLDILH